MRRLLVCVCGVLVASCGGQDPPEDGDLRVERETIGDTTIVRTLSGSTWDQPREAVEELAIGTLEGPDETMFGRIGALAVDSSGGVYVYDAQVPAIRHFDAGGKFVRQVGREGQGPGEYLDAVLAMAVRGDGRLQIWDARNARVTLYDPDGEFSGQWPVSISLFTGDAMFVDDADHTYIKKLTERPSEGAWKIGLLHLDAEGNEVETMPDPEVAEPPDSDGGYLSPSKQWTLAPDASMIVGVNATYDFEIRSPDGGIVRVQRAVEPLAVSDAEFEAHEAMRAWLIENQGQFLTQLPAETARVKPAYRSLHTDKSGRVWVWLYGPIEPKAQLEEAIEGRPPPWPFLEPKVFDVFETDGTYLGRVHVPAGVTVRHFGVDTLWGVREGEMGEAYVVRMRLRSSRDDT